IQKELGDSEEGADLDELEKKIKAAHMPKEARVKAESELKKLKLMSPMSAEATVVRNYIDTLVALPWKKKTKVSNDLKNSEKILQNMTKVGVRNPLFLLDEVDKMGMDFRGDPSSALLEVLDPEQNHTFVDHYVEVEYDLSDVMFVATANTLNIPAPLLDRMEVIRLSGYTEDEKIAIARQYLVPKQMKNNGLKANELHIAESALRDITRYYTREAG